MHVSTDPADMVQSVRTAIFDGPLLYTERERFVVDRIEVVYHPVPRGIEVVLFGPRYNPDGHPAPTHVAYHWPPSKQLPAPLQEFVVANRPDWFLSRRE